ncbi:imidazole glycerol phosphate synthase subunit HisF [Vibrio sp. SCSIO 43140]|uniref:HisA/HisF-related TIM barrel protein n=1 Tax=Vibrio sp. SCSIO 43140 TaxID=2819100 RepID=UPI0020753355|nr:HisA/HisF-related TIM barrel protein [Vibrio sp. SCSIO 43140]USD60245.1 imidazole glycerol phosphate synthase subunit HisF [Vibrio sp. SCSIO 43140]
MLKTRLIPCIITKGELVVQSFGFKRYLPIGNVKTAIDFFVNWDVDEIIVNDIDATKDGRAPNVELVSWAAKECFVPLTVGGGIKSLEHIRQLLKAGADKVAINSLALDNPGFITESSSLFGSQCITVSIDAIKHGDEYRVFDYQKQSALDIDVVEWAMKVESLGAGEILLNSVDRDGSREGYDTQLLRSVSERLSIPVIALGGVGRFDQLAEGATAGGCQALAAANIFQHMEHSTIAAKAQMRSANLNVRLSSEVKYENFELDFLGRPY